MHTSVMSQRLPARRGAHAYETVGAQSSSPMELVVMLYDGAIRFLKQAKGPLAGAFHAMAAQPGTLTNADLGTMWLLTLVGGCLILGLFTRLASLAGIGFVLLFYLCNPPFVGYFYSIPTEGSYLIVNKNLVEIGALLVILTTGSGQFAGLDRIVRALFAPRPKLATAR